MDEFHFNFMSEEQTNELDNVDVDISSSQLPDKDPVQKSQYLRNANLAGSEGQYRYDSSPGNCKKPETADNTHRRRISQQQREINISSPSISNNQKRTNKFNELRIRSNQAFQTTEYTAQSSEMKSHAMQSFLNRQVQTRSTINWNKTSHCWTHTPRYEFGPSIRSNDRGSANSKSYIQPLSQLNKVCAVSSKLDNSKYGTADSVVIKSGGQHSTLSAQFKQPLNTHSPYFQSQNQYSPNLSKIQKEGDILLREVQIKEEADNVETSRPNLLTSAIMSNDITSRQSVKSQQINKIRTNEQLINSSNIFNDTQSQQCQPAWAWSTMNSRMQTDRSRITIGSHRRNHTGGAMIMRRGMELDNPIKQMEVRKLSQNINRMKKNLTRYKVDKIDGKRYTHSESSTQQKAMPDPQQALARLPGFQVKSNVLKRHYTKDVKVKSPNNHNSYNINVQTNNQVLNKHMGNDYRLQNIKGTYKCYQVIMPQRFYENQIKDKIVTQLTGKVNKVKEVQRARAKASKILDASKQKGNYFDQMMRPPLQFVGTQAELEYIARQQKLCEPSIAESEAVVNVSDSMSGNENCAEIMRKMFDKEKKFNLKQEAQSMDTNSRYVFPNYRLWDQEVPINRNQLQTAVRNMIMELTPNSIYARNYLDQVQYEVDRMNLNDLQKTMHQLKLIHKYENQHLEQFGKKNEAKFQFKNIAALGETDKIEIQRQEFAKFAHYFKHHRECHTCKVQINTRMELIMQDVVYTAKMFELKRLINCCFDPMYDPKKMDESSKYWTLAQCVMHLEQELDHGPYTNTELIDLASRSYQNAEALIDLIVPKNKSPYPMLTDILNQLGRHDKMLRNDIDGKFRQFEKFIPLLKSDGVLHLNNLSIDSQLLDQIVDFLGTLKIHPILLKSAVQKLILDNVQIEQQDLLLLLKQFEMIKTNPHFESKSSQSQLDSVDDLFMDLSARKPNSTARNIVGLTLSNMELSTELLQFIGNKLLPQLHCFEMIDIRYVNTGNKKFLMDALCGDLNDLHEDTFLNLVRLKIQSVDLSRQMIFLKTLLDKSQRSLVDLDLGWCNLNFSNIKDLFAKIISISLNDARHCEDGKVRGVFRHLNLSFNPMHIVEKVKKLPKKVNGKAAQQENKDASSDSESSEDNNLAVDDIDELSDLFIFMAKGLFFKKLVHLDLSGISTLFQKELIKILAILADSTYLPNLCFLHLSELCINFNEEIQDAITEHFSIVWPKEMAEKHFGGLYVGLMTYLENWRGQDYRFKQADKFKYADVIQKTLNENPYAKRQLNLLNCIQMGMLNKQKQQFASGSFSQSQGIGRIIHKGHGHDHFVLQRGINLPELVFNQDPLQDRNTRKRYFEYDHFAEWSVTDNSSRKSDCRMCSKQKYTIIFYQRGEQGNQDLFEIKDPEFVKKCRAEYRLKHSLEKKNLKKIKTPLICGTLVTDRDESVKVPKTTTNPISNMTFDRKLRMMRADVFALLSLTTNGKIFKTYEHQMIMKKQLTAFLAGEFNKRVEKMQLFERLIGWNKLLHMKCFKNQLHQVHQINTPDCIKDEKAQLEEPGNDHYVFAAMLDPGYHQFIIYDPAVNKAFCQEFILEPTDQWLYFPELPEQLQEAKKQKPLPPVFNKWVKDSIQRFEMAYDLDTSPFSEDGGKTFRDSFCPERFLKDPEEIKKCEVILKENFDAIQTMYIDILANSKKYPEIGLASLQQGVLDITTQYCNSTGDKFVIDPALIEVAFISATREDSPADRSLSRGEFLEMIIRMSFIKRNLALEKMRKKNAGAGEEANVRVDQAVAFGRLGRKGNDSDDTSLKTSEEYESEGDKSSDNSKQGHNTQITVQSLGHEHGGARHHSQQSLGEHDHGHHHDNSDSDVHDHHHEHSEISPEEAQRMEDMLKIDNSRNSPGLKKKSRDGTGNISKLSGSSYDKKRHNTEEQKQKLQQYGQKMRRTNLQKFQTMNITQRQDVSSNLTAILKYGFWVYHESSLITRFRKAIQNDPKVVKELAKRLRELKKLFAKNCKRGKFTFDSALDLFELDGTAFKESQNEKGSTVKDGKKANKQEQELYPKVSSFWEPMNAFDVWPPFCRSMMTITNEHNNQSKYQHLVLVEFYEYVARIAFRHYELVHGEIDPEKSKQNHKYVAEFLDKLLDRQIELGNLKKRK